MVFRILPDTALHWVRDTITYKHLGVRLTDKVSTIWQLVDERITRATRRTLATGLLAISLAGIGGQYANANRFAEAQYERVNVTYALPGEPIALPQPQTHTVKASENLWSIVSQPATPDSTIRSRIASVIEANSDRYPHLATDNRAVKDGVVVNESDGIKGDVIHVNDELTLPYTAQTHTIPTPPQTVVHSTYRLTALGTQPTGYDAGNLMLLSGLATLASLAVTGIPQYRRKINNPPPEPAMDPTPPAPPAPDDDKSSHILPLTPTTIAKARLEQAIDAYHGRHGINAHAQDMTVAEAITHSDLSRRAFYAALSERNEWRRSDIRSMLSEYRSREAKTLREQHVSIAEIAQHLGVSTSTVYRYTRRPGYVSETPLRLAA